MQLKTGGFLKQNFTDFEGLLLAVVFTQGCNFFCGYCHNPGLIAGLGTLAATEKEILQYLTAHAHWLDALVVTGGEPCLQQVLPGFLQKVRQQTSLQIKPDTNGSYPQVLQHLLDRQLLDYVAIDVKAPLQQQRYQQLAGKRLPTRCTQKIARSLQILAANRVAYEIRMTLVKEYHSP